MRKISILIELEKATLSSEILLIQKCAFNISVLTIHIHINQKVSKFQKVSKIRPIGIDKTDGSDPTRREEYWRRVLKTVTPYGLNTIN